MRDIINTHDQLTRAGGGVAIMYRARGKLIVPGWIILRVDALGQSVVTDERAHWTEYGRKVFLVVDRNSIREKLAEAQTWVAENCGERGPWKRNRAGNYVPKRIDDAFPIRKK